MVREDIIGILKVALQKGKNLQQTVQSLYNSGYSKNEVDEAVQVLNMRVFQQPVIQQIFPSKPVQQPQQPAAPKGQSQQIVSAYPGAISQPRLPSFPQPAQQPSPSFPQTFQYPQPYQPQYYQPQQFFSPEIAQKVSSYESRPKPNIGKTITIIMVIILVVLLGILIAVFLFKDELTSFINNL